MAQISGFEIILLSTNNIHQYIPADELKLIDSTLKKLNYIEHQKYSDIYRLTVLYHHGGIYIDANTIVI